MPLRLWVTSPDKVHWIPSGIFKIPLLDLSRKQHASIAQTIKSPSVWRGTHPSLCSRLDAAPSHPTARLGQRTEHAARTIAACIQPMRLLHLCVIIHLSVPRLVLTGQVPLQAVPLQAVRGVDMRLGPKCCALCCFVTQTNHLGGLRVIKASQCWSLRFPERYCV